MPVIIWIIAVPVFLYALVEACPLVVITWTARAKRGFRSYLVKRYGRKMANEFIAEKRAKYAKMGVDLKHLDKQFEKLRPMIEEKLGNNYADDFLGRQSFLEREF